ncbi:uncharacterized protein LOC136082750 [Hydra vulgaris]|uniref:Uncharacterized protein LOC136082750 n=1 Tax=Hydra vulgaris TaxID=6087 RepID=A0ABM4C9C4_HYDVU
MPNLIFDENHGNLSTKWSCKNFTFLTNEMYFKLYFNLIKEYSPYFERGENGYYNFSPYNFIKNVIDGNDIEILTSQFNQAMNLHTPTKPSDFSDEEILKTKKEPLCISVIKEKNCIENEESNYHYTVENDKEENKDSKACEDDIEFSGDVNKLLCNYEIKEINFTENEDGNSKACENED